jgi:hypothetical protein
MIVMANHYRHSAARLGPVSAERYAVRYYIGSPGLRRDVTMGRDMTIQWVLCDVFGPA